MNEAREEKKKMLMRVWLGCERDNYWCSPHAKSCTFVSLNFIFLISSLDSPLVGIFFPFCVRCVWQFTIPKRWIFHFIFFIFLESTFLLPAPANCTHTTYCLLFFRSYHNITVYSFFPSIQNHLELIVDTGQFTYQTKNKEKIRLNRCENVLFAMQFSNFASIFTSNYRLGVATW